MEKAIEVAIEKINEMKLERKRLWKDKKKLLVEMEAKFPIKVKGYQDKKQELINIFNPNCKDKREAYLEVVLDCYNELLADENNETLRKIFNKYRPFAQCQTINLINQIYDEGFHKLRLCILLNLSKEGFNLLEKINNLKKEISDYENSTEDSQWIEDLKTLSESHLAALKIAEEWHQNDLSAKVELRIKELNLIKTQSLIEK